jgi:probable rRNA maturation factor
MAVEVINRQRRYQTDRERLAEVAASTLAAVERDGAEVSVTLSNDRRLRALNRMYRGKDKATDVLSFPYDEPGGPLGDVIISVDRAYAQAAERGHSLQRELELLTLHGTLHVCGYDHETDNGEMDRIERRLRKRFVSS